MRRQFILLYGVKAVAPAGHSPCWRPAVMTRGSIICCSSFTIPHQRENTTTAASPSTTNTHPRFCTHPHTFVSIKLIFEQKTGFISETSGVLLTNADFHVSLIHLPCYSTWHFNPVIVIPQGNENDIRVTNTIFLSAHQPGELMESNVQLPLKLIDFWINSNKLD